ncbi:helix-turn-helix domain-containing protein [Marivita geojedonensis]|uniref:DNA-binding protein n=1 Tax=Marivita geojedonensis TaxID=1123756 RepID=A0A1X4NHV8_9RHOB|nr:XRE family transcriptional regulator [Marivita geojedonensis]OSQ47580.1 DNA-binding protein [Marivita geojedonensis]PRY74569.1 XRE family transcriptional regulator [Marivita geojedonensis]
MSAKQPDIDAERLGSEIREVRKARGLTLDDLSAQLSCSTAYLSRIERGTANVSDSILKEISAALGVAAEWFFPVQSGEGPLERRHVVRAQNRRPLSDMYTRSKEELGFEDELLSSTLSGQCYLILSRFPPGAGEPPEPLPGYEFEGEQHAMVLSGEVELRLGHEVIILSKGDSFSYPSMIAHRFRNRGKTEATMIWAMSPVRISW